jgi:hypothetical protein
VLYAIDISASHINLIKTSFLLSGQSSDHYWTDIWMAYKANPTSNNKNMVESRLQGMFKYLLGLPEFQLC